MVPALIVYAVIPFGDTVHLFGRDVTRMSVRRRVRLGLGRTYQSSRVLGGLSVEDNLFLAVLGTQGGHFRPLPAGADPCGLALGPRPYLRSMSAVTWR